VLNGLNSQPCVSGPSFGTVTIANASGGTVSVTVDLFSSDLKFRDLMINFDALGSGITEITSSDGQVSLSSNSFSIPPYSGLFDVGSTGAQGWNGDHGYTTILTPNTGSLSENNFLFLDSGGKIYVALHIQSIGDSSGGDCSGSDNGTTNCVPGTAGNGSLKIGGLLQQGDPSEIPEPATIALLGGGLLLLGVLRRRRKV
jgi:hypothetical protein